MARQHGIFIPRLCELEGLSDVGACRLCLVEVKGTSNACCPPASLASKKGMEVTTDSERLQRYRREILELLFTRTESRLLGLRFEWQLRVAVPGPETRILRTFTFLIAIQSSKSTPRTTASWWTTTAAFFAPAAFECATRLKARTPGM